MKARFKTQKVYSGETLFGGCGFMDRNKITVIRRTKGWLVYKEQYGKIRKTRRSYTAGWGDCIITRFDEFYAYSLEPLIKPF